MKRTKSDLNLTETRQRVLLALGWYSIAIHRGITRFAHDAGWVLSGGFVRHGWFPQPWQGDGVLTVLGIDNDVDEAVLAMNLPTVNIGYTAYPGIATVSADSEAVGRMAAEHFVSRGFKNFAFYESSGLPGEQMRRAGYEASLKARGYKCHLIGKPSAERQGESINAADAYHLVGRQLAELPMPVAVLAEYDDRAIDVMDAALLAGLRVPEQVAVLGVDNDELRCPFAPVPLSSIDNDEERIGYEAARVLHDVMQGKPAPDKPLRIPPRRVVVRQSTNILAIPHEHVATALKMIWEHYNEPIDAVRVAAEIPLSYPQLHVSFVKYVGHSMADEIERLRLEHAQQLLITTDAKLSDIAHKSGFGSADRMGRVFVRRLQTNPSEYRLKMKGASSQSATQRGTAARPAAFHQI
ncbi:MAG: substrate-binding domain-containing protein [Tepidisphaeraceae bacterium]